MDLHKYIHAMENDDDDDEKNMEKIFPPHWVDVYVHTAQSLYERYTLATIPFAIKRKICVYHNVTCTADSL